jgi:hypothetical protein
MNKSKTFRVFFSQRAFDHDKYLILLSGKETNVIVSKHDIITILTAAEFMRFCNGDMIFDIEVSRMNPYLKQQKPLNKKDKWKVQ